MVLNFEAHFNVKLINSITFLKMTVFVVNMMLYLTHYILLKTVQHHEEIRALQVSSFAKLLSCLNVAV